jgi:hypothetical protein
VAISPNGSNGHGPDDAPKRPGAGRPGPLRRRTRTWLLLAVLGGLIAAVGGYGIRAVQDFGRLQAEERERARLSSTPPAVPPAAFTRTTVSVVSGGRFQAPRATVTGTVTTRERQLDGDIEVRLEAGGASLVLEIVPELPLPEPPPGERVAAWGIVRFDTVRGRWELHPLLGWRRTE